METTTTADSDSVLFHPIDNIHPSISFWVITTAIDFTPYENEIEDVFAYAKQIRDYITDQLPIYYEKDQRYTQLLNITFSDIGLAITELKNTKIEAHNYN